MSARVFAPAKINLTLKVGAPRADGFHPLESVVAFADVGDIVDAEMADGLSLEIVGEFAEALVGEGNNLVLRAARVLARAAEVEAGARLVLEKNLPIASGIGGGSADAAATLLALNQLWDLGWPPRRLAEIGRDLGADVPVFLSGSGAASMRGVGDICAPLALAPLPAVLINPLKPLATPDVYRQFDAMKLGSALTGAPTSAWRTLDEAVAAMQALGNDLEAPARALLPEIGDILSALRDQAGVRHAALSGSGATVFAILSDRECAESLAEEMQARHRNWWVADAMLGA